MNNRNVGKRLIALRGNKSRKEVANELNISKSALAMYERGERMPRDLIKVNMAKYFNTTVQELFFITQEVQ